MQSKNQNDSIQLSSRYQQYDFAKRHLRGQPRPQVFPIRGAEQNTSELQKSERDVKLFNPYNPKHNNDRIYSEDGLYAMPVLTPERTKKRQNGRRFKKNGEVAFTQTAQDHHGIYDGIDIRKLTPTECERLQGFPDSFTKYGINEKGEQVEISDSQRYKVLGNAVTVNVIQTIIEKLIN